VRIRSTRAHPRPCRKARPAPPRPDADRAAQHRPSRSDGRRARSQPGRRARGRSACRCRLSPEADAPAAPRNPAYHRIIGLKAIGLDEHDEARRRQTLPAQFLGRARRVGSNRFAHFRRRTRRPPEGAQRLDAFDDAEPLSDQARIDPLEIERCRDAERRKPCGKRPATPYRSVSWMRARGGILHRVGGRHGRNAPHPQAVAHNSDGLRFMDMFVGILGATFVSI